MLCAWACRNGILIVNICHTNVSWIIFKIIRILNQLYHAQSKTTLVKDSIFKMIHDNIIDHNNLQFICFDSGINNISTVCVDSDFPQLCYTLLHKFCHCSFDHNNSITCIKINNEIILFIYIDATTSLLTKSSVGIVLCRSKRYKFQLKELYDAFQ